MKTIALFVIVSSLIISCDSPAPKQSGSGASAEGELQGSHDTGIWQNGTYTDEFGQTSDRDCIRTKGFISGSFSNATTPHAPLNVSILIFNPNSISLQVFEFAGNTPLKALSPQSYSVSIEGPDGAEHKVKAVNYSDKIAFEKTDARTVHDILMKGGRIQFSITGDFNTSTRYLFTIDNATGYDAAYRILSEK